MNKPVVHAIFYGYKNKVLKDSVISVINNASSNIDLKVTVYDQNPLIRDDFFDNVDNCRYIHIYWDYIVSPMSHINSGLNQEESDYTMVSYGRVELSKNWDIDLIKFTEDHNSVVSGKNKTVMKQKNLFYLERYSHRTNDFTISNYIDKDFIFGRSSTIQRLRFPDYLKHQGVNEVMSLSYFTSGINIYSAPDSFYQIIGPDTIESTYTTFSKSHGYNEFIQLAKTEKNNHVVIKNRQKSVKEFEDFHGIDFGSLKKLPFPIDDVEYKPHEMPFDEVDQKKFMTKVNYIA